MRYKRIGYNINVMRQSACLVIDPIMVDSFASLLNCKPVGRASESKDGPNIKLVDLLKFGVQLVVFFCSGISVVLFYTLGFSGCHNTCLSSPHL